VKRPEVLTAAAADATTIITKIENATQGLPPHCFYSLYNRVLCTGSKGKGKENALAICDYVSSLKAEINLSDNYRKVVIMLFCHLSIFFNNNTKSFNEITRQDLLSFLDSRRKSEDVDPLHKWIGTYNTYRVHLMRFFKWLYFPDIEPDKRPKPPVIQNIHQLKRKEKSIYKPTDLWTAEDDALFLKYCPNPRDRCYHAMSRDSAARPHELLKLRIKDVVFKLTSDKQYAEILINGKTGTRQIPLIDSIPYIKDWVTNHHPQAGNPNSILICGFGKSLNRAIGEIALYKIYQVYKKVFFPKLLDDPNVPPEDKRRICELLKKPWNPYVRRHSSLTEKSGILKEHHLRQFAGWSPGSNMHLKYIHYLGNESSESLLEAYGIVPKDKQLSDVLRPKPCPNCNEPNKLDSKFCAKCRMVLTYDAYNETVEDQKQKENEIKKMQEQFNMMQSAQKEMLEMLKDPDKLFALLKRDK
jgi:integrase